MSKILRCCAAMAGLAGLAALSITDLAAQQMDASVWDGCSARPEIDPSESFRLMAPAGSPGVELECENCSPTIPNDGQPNPGRLSLKANQDGPPTEVELVNQEGRRFIAQAPATFTIADERPLENGAITFAPGQSIDVKIPKATVVRHKTVPVLPDLTPTSAGPEVKVIVSKPGEVLTAADWKAGVGGCFVPIGGTVGRPLPVVKVQSTELGVAEVTLQAPDNLFATGTQLWTGGDARFLVYDAEGYMGEGALTTWRPWPAMTMAFAFAVVIFAGLAFAAKRAAEGLGTGYKVFLLGLFTSRDGDASLSLFQVFLWTLVTVWALSYVFLVTSDILTLTPQIMVLLGFASLASVSARWIASSRARSGGFVSDSVPDAGDGESKDAPEFWAMLITDGKPDLLKVQLFAFTVLGAAYVVWKVATSIAFPVLDENLLLLMGVSNLAYVGGKLADRPSVYDKASALDQKIEFHKTQQERLNTELKEKQQKRAVEAGKPPDQQDLELLKELDARIETLAGKDGKSGRLGNITKQLADLNKELDELHKQIK